MENSLFMAHVLAMPYCTTAIKYLFAQQFNLITFEKGQILSTKFQLHRTLYFLESGMVREFGPIKNTIGNFKLLSGGHFLVQDGVVLEKLFSGNLEFLQQTVLYGVDFKRIEWFCKKYPDAVRLLLYIQEERIISGIEREYLLRITKADERFQYFKQTQQHLLNNASQAVISSYLNLSKKHLNRIIKMEARRR